MVRLTAKYDVNLKNGEFLINRSQREDLSFTTRIEDFDVELHLDHDPTSRWTSVEGEGAYWPISKIRIVVGRDEDSAPPMPRIVDGRRRSFQGLKPYCDEREPAYRKAALYAVNRAVLFFKYKLHNPNLSLLSDQDLLNFQWSVNGGDEFNPTHYLSCKSHDPGSRFSIEHLSPQRDSDILTALNSPICPELSEELMSDAQSAVLQNNLRRAVLEMAIACEIAVKQAFFAKATPAGAAYEYLEDKGRVHVPITELLHNVAKQAFGKSFKEEEPSNYNNVDFLFRGRNKVAHRGELVYRDGTGNLQSIDEETLAEWWESVMILRAWILANAR